MKLRIVLDALAAVVFPAPCRICGTTLVDASLLPICGECFEEIQPLNGPACVWCGRPFGSARATEATQPLCHACRRGLYAFDRARSYAAYNDAMSAAVTLLKYEGVTRLGKWFAARLKETLERDSGNFHPDVVVPVPLHPLRLRERGYNQAELIARPLAKRLGLPLKTYLLVRSRPRPDKLLLSRSERWSSVRGAYATRPGERVDKLSILLVDDVFTTGATLDACARALRGAGAAAVYGLTVARVMSSWFPPASFRQPASGETREASPASDDGNAIGVATSKILRNESGE